MGIKSYIVKIFTSRDELSFKNIRAEMWGAILVFPLSFVISNIRQFDIDASLWGLSSTELINFSLGFGWLLLFFLPKRWILPAFQVSALIALVILPFQIVLPEGLPLLVSFIAFQFFLGICLAVSFYVFSFALNNAERLFGMFFVFFCLGILYHSVLTIPIFAANQQTIGIIIAMFAYLVIVVRSFRKKKYYTETSFSKNAADAKNSEDPFNLAVFLIILLVLVNHIIFMIMNNLAMAGHIDTFSMRLGMPFAIILILVFQFLINRSALYSWLLALVFSFLGVGLLLLDTPMAFYTGSFFSGFGNSIGQIITLFMCGGAIEVHKSFRMYKVFCLMFFVDYVFFSGLFFSFIYSRIDLPENQMAFGIILSLCCIYFVMMPYLQQKFINSPWSDKGANLADMGEYTGEYAGKYTLAIAEIDQLDEIEKLGLSPREKEIFILLLGDSQRKHIADTLKIGAGTVNFHVNNLYKKLGIQSRVELFAKYGNNRENHI
jgi:DNA-binding CsgD family transcriptional regulator